MVKILEEFPGVHATFNIVPLLAEQIEEYVGGRFQEPWFDIAFAHAGSLEPEQKREALERAFQVNENFINRWPRFAELASQLRSGGAEACVAHWSLRDWRDLQLLSQLAWMDEEYLAKDPVVHALSEKGKNFSEEDKAALLEKQQELLAAVLLEYHRAAARGQIEISTTPYYHPILPLLCDTDIARVSNPHTPLPHPAFRYPEDAREQLFRARKFHERVFGKPPVGLWPSEGSVSDQALEIAMELGFKWFATDEGVLGRTRNEGFWRDASGYPENGPDLYTPWRLERSREAPHRFFPRSLPVGPRRLRLQPHGSRIGGRGFSPPHPRDRRPRTPADAPPPSALSSTAKMPGNIIPGNGREFLRRFYQRIEADPEIQVLTMSEAIEAVADPPRLQGIFPASWISANFDVWIGHSEDVRAWDLLRDAREAYERAKARHAHESLRRCQRLGGQSTARL